MVCESQLEQSGGKKAKLVLGVCQDISWEKQTENTIQGLDVQLQEKFVEFESLLGAVAGNLRSPLWDTQRLSSELDRDFNTLRQKMMADRSGAKLFKSLEVTVIRDITAALNTVRSHTAIANLLLNGLAQLDKLKTMKLRTKPLDMNFLVEDVVTSGKFEFEQKRLDVEIDDLPLCLADKSQIKCLFSNLIDNACRHRQLNKTGYVKITGWNYESNSIYCVEDDAEGISEKDIPRAFSVLGKVGKTDQVGLGLGLSFVKTVLERHKGSIHVESKPGKGTKIYITLPSDRTS
jgi:signal transduction histidine kinase